MGASRFLGFTKDLSFVSFSQFDRETPTGPQRSVIFPAMPQQQHNRGMANEEIRADRCTHTHMHNRQMHTHTQTNTRTHISPIVLTGESTASTNIMTDRFSTQKEAEIYTCDCLSRLCCAVLSGTGRITHTLFGFVQRSLPGRGAENAELLHYHHPHLYHPLTSTTTIIPRQRARHEVSHLQVAWELLSLCGP